MNYRSPRFRTAIAVLEANDHGSRISRTRSKSCRLVYAWSRRQSILASTTPYEALIQERQVTVRYLQRPPTEVKEYLVHRLGVIMRDTVR